MKRLPFNDDWIRQNVDIYKTYKRLAEEHNKLFGTSFTREQMKNHASLILDVHTEYYYTDEMKAWIIENYPKSGTAEEKAEEFNSIFGTNKNGQAIKEMARLLGVSLSEEALKDYKQKSKEHICNFNRTVRAAKPGHVGRPSNGYLLVKLENGEWLSQGRYEYEKHYGKVPKNHNVIFLDGNRNNVSKENLMAIPVKLTAIMSANKFWSSDPELTKTGVVYCNLYTLF